MLTMLTKILRTLSLLENIYHLSKICQKNCLCVIFFLNIPSILSTVGLPYIQIHFLVLHMEVKTADLQIR